MRLGVLGPKAYRHAGLAGFLAGSGIYQQALEELSLPMMPHGLLEQSRTL